MNYVARFRPELVDDAAEAFHYYEEQAEGLGHALLHRYYAAIAAVERNPEIHLRTHGEFRRVLLAKFPYALHFRMEGNVIVFVLLFPAVRNPRLLRKKLRSRQDAKPLE